MPVVFATALLLMGCVNLKKPKIVEECEKAPGGCTNDWKPNPDAGEDLADPPGADVAPNDLLTPKKDLGSDVVAPDGPAEDGPLPGKETGDDGRTDLIAAPETTPDNARDDGRTDLLDPGPESAGAEPGPERGPEPGAEPGKEPGPEPGPEPGKEPGAEPGPEPGPEPGKEPGGEPGPEPQPELPRDGGTDGPGSNCSIFFGSTPATGSSGHPPAAGTTAAYCVATCDDITGWGCSNDTGRTVTVNGTVAACGAAITKKNGYYVFQVSAGANVSATLYWWGTYATTCTAPAGGF